MTKKKAPPKGTANKAEKPKMVQTAEKNEEAAAKGCMASAKQKDQFPLVDFGVSARGLQAYERFLQSMFNKEALQQFTGGGYEFS